MNKRLFFKALGLAALLVLGFDKPCAHAAGGAAPAMYGVKQILLQYTQFADPKTADECGLSREEINTAIYKALLIGQIPAIQSKDAKPLVAGESRIDLVPKAYTINNQLLDCTSWVELTAESKSRVTVPPIDTLRNVKIVYWNRGTLISSAQATHQQFLAEAAQKMAEQFAKDYRLDQPPEMPTP